MDRWSQIILTACLLATITQTEAQQVTSSRSTLPGFDQTRAALARITLRGKVDNVGDVNQTGTGIVIGSNGFLLTAYHVVGIHEQTGRDIYDQQGLNLEVELPNANAVLQRVPARVFRTEKRDKGLDFAILEMQGTGYSVAPCEFVSLREPEGTRVWSLAWRAGLSVPDRNDGSLRERDPRFGLRYNINVPAARGNSGGAILNPTGQVIAVITSGLEQDVTSPLTFATPLSYIAPFLPPDSECANLYRARVATDPAVIPGLSLQNAASALQNCERRQLAELSVNPISIESASFGVRCEGGGLTGKSNYQRAVQALRAPPGYYVMDNSATVVVDSENNGSLESIAYLRDTQTGRAAGVEARVSCRSPGVLFGPGGWYHGKIVAKAAPLVTTERQQEISQQCQAEVQKTFNALRAPN